MHKKLVATHFTDDNVLEMLISFDCSQSRENIAHEDNPVSQWEYYYEVNIKWAEFIFGGTSIRIMKYNELTQKQKTLVDLIAQDQAHELFNK
jgi:hypothetical protein